MEDMVMIPISGLSFAAALTGGVGLIVSTSLGGIGSFAHPELFAAAAALVYSLSGLLTLRALVQPGMERPLSPACPNLAPMKRAA
jgi:hypothetical protein